jgi:hypothetical protein
MNYETFLKSKKSKDFISNLIKDFNENLPWMVKLVDTSRT